VHDITFKWATSHIDAANDSSYKCQIIYIHIHIHIYVCICTYLYTCVCMFSYKCAISHINEARQISMRRARMMEPYHIWMSYVTYIYPRFISMRYVTCKRAISHKNTPCHIYLSYGTHSWDMSRIQEPYHIYISHITYRMSPHMTARYHI